MKAVIKSEIQMREIILKLGNIVKHARKNVKDGDSVIHACEQGFYG